MMAVLDLKAFFDEAGTHATSDVAVLAGLLGPADAWAAVEKAISDDLNHEAVDFYHATDVEAHPRPRGKYKKWSRTRARAFTDRITAILVDAPQLVGLGVFVDAKDWLAATDLIKPFFQQDDTEKLTKTPFKLPYHILVKTCLGVVMESLNPSLPPNEKVAFVFEDNDWKHAVIDGYDVFKKLHPQSSRFGTIAFEPKIGFPGLQAADLLAWSYRRIKALQLGYAKGEPERSFLSLLREDFVFKHLTKAALEDELKKSMDLIFSGKIT
jgi:Protein of unknown function (DUF3800)